MSCYHPLQAFYKKTPNPLTGLRGLVFSSESASTDDAIKIPCGQCIGCRLEKSRQWAIRIMLENQMSSNSKFITLTYNQQHLPKNQSLNKQHITLFLKKLRKHLTKQKISIRYYQCGEYGTLNNRPHHHAIIFINGGTSHLKQQLFEDEDFIGSSDGQNLYTSKTLEKIWGMGYVTLGSVTFESAGYVARYCTKKITGSKAKHHYGDKLPEYATMSRRPGIGRSWYDTYKSDVINTDKIITRELQMLPPKYYDTIHKHEDPEQFKLTKERRLSKVKQSEQTLERLSCKERIKTAKFKTLTRGYENG